MLQLYYSTLNNSCCLKPELFVINNRQNLRGHQLTLKMPIIRTFAAAYHNFFSIRYLNLWNSLPYETIFSQSFSLFSSRLYNEPLL